VAAQTLAQKLLAKACGQAAVQVGQIVTCRVDLAMVHDSSGPRRQAEKLAALGAPLWDPKRLVVVSDHYWPAQDEEARQVIEITRDWSAKQGVTHYEGQGICHVVLPERGHLRPGMFAVGGDSHSPTGGAFAAYMFGIGATEMLSVLVTGEIWVKVPPTLRFTFNGTLAAGVCAKDMMLFLLAKHGMDGGQYAAVEYAGSAVRALSIQERMTLANMSAELGAQTGLVAADEVTLEALVRAGVAPSLCDALRDELKANSWEGDSDASYGADFSFDASALSPYVAAPHSPANGKSVGEYAGTALDLVYLGACTGAKLADLRMAAQVLRGKRIDPRLRFMVAPASQRDQAQAQAEGVMQVLIDAGATVLPTSCGACAGYGQAVGESQVVLSSTARNFKGRMGAASAQVYLASPYTLAASALRGVITDPREVLA
jgi:3-isopropylmalate/(R)-2-methylmalate dehydratase large subunit